MLLGLIFILICSSAFFSGSEAALLRLRTSKVASESKKNFLARITLNLLKNLDKVLPMILLGNTFANILVGSLLSNYLLLRNASSTLVIIAPFVLSLIILIFAEILPKTLATLFAEKLAYFTSPILAFLYFISKPITLFLSKFNKLLLSLIGVQSQSNGDFITRDEYKVMIEQGSSQNKQFHHSLMLGILELAELDVNKIMITRNEIDTINLKDDPESIKKNILHSRHDSMIVTNGNIDNIVGTIINKDAWKILLSEHFDKKRLHKILQEPYFIPEKISIPRQWQQFQLHEKRLAIVINEFGETLGLVSKSDIVQEIFVNSQSEDLNLIELGIAQLSKNTWMINGSTGCHHLTKVFSWPLPNSEADTVSGALINTIESIPQPGCVLKCSSILYEVVQVSQHKILKIKVTDLTKS